MAVIKKTAIAVDAGFGSLFEDANDSVPFQTSSKVGSRRILHAMHRPKCLRQSIQLNLLECLLARMIRCKTPMVWRVPILRGDHQRKPRLELIGCGDHLIASRHSQRAPGQKV